MPEVAIGSDNCDDMQTGGPTDGCCTGEIKCDEPIVGHGPFVMNSRDEIMQAIRDFESGNFGQIAR